MAHLDDPIRLRRIMWSMPGIFNIQMNNTAAVSEFGASLIARKKTASGPGGT